MLVSVRLGGVSADRWICIIMHRKVYPGIKIEEAESVLLTLTLQRRGYLEGY